MLKELGVNAVWNEDSYSVNVNVHTKVDDKINETALLKDIYSWLKDTDMALWMYAVKLQQYADSDLTTNQVQLLDIDYTELSNLYNESTKFTTEMMSKINSNHKITDIIKNQSDAIAQISQTKDLLKIWIDQKSNIQFTNSLKTSSQNSFTISQKNFNYTNKCMHELIKNQYKDIKQT